jgi:hypothetical protein
MIYMAVYGLIGISQLVLREVFHLDFLPPVGQQIFYNPWAVLGRETPFSLGFALAHSLNMLVQVFIVMFLSHWTVRLYFFNARKTTVAFA